MDLVLRKGTPADAAACGRICYEAFKTIASEHNFPSDIASPEHGVHILTQTLADPGFFGIVAEFGGRIVGSNFLDERNPISGVGPITVDPQAQNNGAGRELMRAVMKRSEERGSAGIRLPGYIVRPAAERDLDACNHLCIRVHGHHRGGELREAIARGSARVVERMGRITGYATMIAFFAHAVGETNDDLKALIRAAESFEGAGFLVPSRNGDLMRWCLGKGLRVTQSMTLMTMGCTCHRRARTCHPYCIEAAIAWSCHSAASPEISAKGIAGGEWSHRSPFRSAGLRAGSFFHRRFMCRQKKNRHGGRRYERI
jgi:predicted N-acetyltransferase YhbS